MWYVSDCQSHTQLFYSNDLTTRLTLSSAISMVGISELMLSFYFQRFAFHLFQVYNLLVLSATMLHYHLTLYLVLRNTFSTCINVYRTKMWLTALN